MITFSDRLKELRKEKRLTQKQLAQILFIDDTSISKYENGKNGPENVILQQMADYFEVSIDYLLGRTDTYVPQDLAQWNPSLNEKDNKSLDKIVENFENGLSGDIMLDGEILDEETKELLLKSVRHAYEFAKMNNKAKFTPKKYRK